MKILIVNYYYSPLVNAHSYRWAQIARYWAGQGHSVEVIANRFSGLARRAEDAGVLVRRTGPVSSKNPVEGASGRSSTTLFGALKSRVKAFARKIYRLFYWPDGLWYWTPFALCELIASKKTHYDLVVSYAPCFGAHLSVLLFKKITRKSFVWIADYGDPFSTSFSMQPNNFRLYSSLNRRVERAVLTNAIPTFTSQATKSEYEDYFSLMFRDGTLVPHLVDVGRFHAGTGGQSRNSGKITLVYVGAFFKGIREPDSMLRFFAAAKHSLALNFEVHLYGPDNGFELSRVDPPVFYHGLVDREAALKKMKSADFIINVNNDNCSMVPSKMVECMATGRPLVDFGKAAVLAGMDGYRREGMVFEIGPDFMEKDIQDFGSFLKRKKGEVVPEGRLCEILAPHLLEGIASNYLERAQ